jgi:hypothetical protein
MMPIRNKTETHPPVSFNKRAEFGYAGAATAGATALSRKTVESPVEWAFCARGALARHRSRLACGRSERIPRSKGDTFPQPDPAGFRFGSPAAGAGEGTAGPAAGAVLSRCSCRSPGRSPMWLRRGSALLLLALVSGAPASGDVDYFLFELSGATANPPTPSPATGSGLLVYISVTHQLEVFLDFAGLIGTTMAAHLHCCIAPPASTTVAVGFVSFPIGFTAGTYQLTFDLTQTTTYSAAFLAAHGGTAAGAEAALADGLRVQHAYVDIHTSIYPGGEVRGYPAWLVFLDGFESGDFSDWDDVFPGDP